MYGEDYPELLHAERLVNLWLEAGLCGRMSDGSPAPLSWVEIDAFVRLNGYDINQVEAACLMDMSRAYSNAVMDTDPLSIPPMDRPR